MLYISFLWLYFKKEVTFWIFPLLYICFIFYMAFWRLISFHWSLTSNYSIYVRTVSSCWCRCRYIKHTISWMVIFNNNAESEAIWMQPIQRILSQWISYMKHIGTRSFQTEHRPQNSFLALVLHLSHHLTCISVCRHLPAFSSIMLMYTIILRWYTLVSNSRNWF